jgi:hypothetical protein
MRKHALDRQMRLAGVGWAQYGSDAGAASAMLTIGGRRKRNRHSDPDRRGSGATTTVLTIGLLYHNVTLESPVLNMWNESGTNRGRIGDSTTVRVRSPRYMVLSPTLNTRSGGIGENGSPSQRQDR